MRATGLRTFLSAKTRTGTNLICPCTTKAKFPLTFKRFDSDESLEARRTELYRRFWRNLMKIRQITQNFRRPTHATSGSRSGEDGDFFVDQDQDLPSPDVQVTRAYNLSMHLRLPLPNLRNQHYDRKSTDPWSQGKISQKSMRPTKRSEMNAHEVTRWSHIIAWLLDSITTSFTT